MSRGVRAVFLVALLAASTLAGCVGAQEELPAPADDLVTSAQEDPPRSLPDNRSGEFAAFRETNVTRDDDHHHDYWQGRQVIEIARERIAMGSIPGTSGIATQYRPPVGIDHLVFEGTGRLEIAISDPERRPCIPLVVGGSHVCPADSPDPAPPSGLNVQFQHASSSENEWIEAGIATWDEPAVILIEDPTWTDMPHTTGSMWAFRFHSSRPEDAGLTFEIALTAYRVRGEIPRWPGHPDFYTESHYRLVLDAPGMVSENIAGAERVEVEPGRLVSAGTRTLLVFANITSVEGVLPPTHWYLYFHNASARNWNLTAPVTPETEYENRELFWALPVDENAMDSPYATESRWRFMIRGASAPVGTSCIRSCSDYTVKYHLTIIASDLEHDDYATTRPWTARRRARPSRPSSIPALRRTRRTGRSSPRARGPTMLIPATSLRDESAARRERARFGSEAPPCVRTTS